MSYYTPTFPTVMQQQPYGGYQFQPQQRQTIPQAQTMSGYICRPVASEEEARAIPTDFSGATLVMVDAAHNRIYTKSLNIYDGSAVFTAFDGPKQHPVQAPVEYAPMSAVSALRTELEELKSYLRKDIPYDESNANDAIHAERRKPGRNATANDGQ